ncbi:LAGLIDADG family homing endonuclease [Fictibacillus sp. 18YEL24]|uniref:LAGLIDADG family homing endonuclease n=1 Tax=Fictibacillus sp. 18YEL24 TaxID=2745875 RepID=UPI0018CEAE4D|nr:LAGLIDADG family homing endonuclease [Fictibacillus sp. 18YEL24]MBH0168005.1 endonuclease [Fictibacillus sp. 18YEL24]
MRKKKCTMSIPTIIECFQMGMTSNEIALQANVTARYINSVLQQHNVERQPHSSWLRRYTVNENYFKTWSASMAYVLGFFAADGCLPKDLQLVSFSQKDPKILEDIREELQSTHPIKTNPRTGVHLLNISSKIMKEDLMKLHGMSPKKSTILEFPYVPEEYLSHFVRGFFDGDGNINYKKRTVSFVGGSQTFMEHLKKRLERYSFEPFIVSKEKYHRLFLSGRKTVYHFGQWIYKDKNLYIERKHLEFNREKLPPDQIKDRPFKAHKSAIEARKLKLLYYYNLYRDFPEACKSANIGINTFYRWISTDEEFQLKFNSICNEKKI